MKKLLWSVIFLVAFQMRAEAFVPLPVDETYTGETAGQAGDTPFLPNSFTSLPLGGPVGNQYIVKQAHQFTVNQPDVIQYVSISALLVPWANIYDNAVDQYISQRLAQGATPEEIGAEINGPDRTFFGPAQSISVNFALVKGSVPYHDSTTLVLPTSDVLANASYTFFTDDSFHTKQYTDLLIPFAPSETELDRHADYWIVATDPFSGIRMGYSTRLFGQINTPEPASVFLLGGGLLGAFYRRKRQR